jgi:hypothetical protein
MFAIDYPHRITSTAGYMRHAMKSSIIPEQSQRKAVIQSAHDEAPRPVRKNRVRSAKRMLLVIENGSTSAQQLVQSTIRGRAPSKII